MKRVEKPITFRAYADRGRVFWVHVRVFETRRDMVLDVCKATGKCDPDTAGQVSEAAFYRKGKKSGAFAVMWLNRKDVNKHATEITAHEALHAAIRYFERRRWPVCLHSESKHGAPDPHEHTFEERLAYTVGRISKYITRGLFRHGVWK